ncbi:acetoin catabolism regulatory protein [mine drainage metagenome]|uniref:Acetoin catabolism regulatory protein n=1 Tax=mine drainage metagenome TaxID=410659 RepID=A0A1J5SBB1_9ZZZZ
MQSTPSASVLRQARSHLLEHGDCLPGTIDERVARSWRRSLDAGLLPTGRLADREHSSGGNLRHALACNHDLLAHSRPVMEYLFEQVRHSHSMVILADNRATLMHTMGDVDFLTKAERVALSTGSSWQEQHRGTNAIGTALAEACSVEIHGAEHFLERNGFLTCAAAPIMSAAGELMGVIDISGDQRSRHPHTLGLVSMAARMIENRLVIAACRQHIRLHLHTHPEGIGSVAEGIVALSEDGWIVGANRTGLAMLRLTPADLSTTPLSRCMDVRFEELLARHKRHPDQPTQVRLHDGNMLFVHVYAEQAALTITPPATGTIAAPNDALSRLDTGDLRWRAAAEKARRIVGKPIPLLIHGESGVGKELFARAVHDSGPRAEGPFVAINCAALPENLIESELFGYSPGAFTGAKREGYIGRLREAHGGTLFLDEIGDMPLSMQTRLLRVLQERQVSPLGGGRAIDVDFALICATHCKLREAADRGIFRSDLYYRINGLTVTLPALRERSDFQALTERMLACLNPERDIYLAPDLLSQLSRHPWPGNLRQYSNVLRTACAMLEQHEDLIDWRHLSDDLIEELTAIPKSVALSNTEAPSQNLDEISRSAIRQALECSSGNISEAARRLGISRQTLYRKLNT